MDLQQQGSGGGVGVGGSRLKAVGNVLIALLFQLVRYARANPQRFGIVAGCLFMILWMMYTAPRTGCVVSKSRGILSSGHSSLFVPPKAYVSHYLSNINSAAKSASSHKDAFGCTRRIGDVVRDFDENGLTVEKKTPKEVSMSIIARKAFSLDAL